MRSMTTEPKATDEQPQEEVVLSAEEEEELDLAIEASLKDEEEGKLVPWEALFPPTRMTG